MLIAVLRWHSIAFVMLLDIKKYMHHVDQLDLSQAQKEELMHTVWRLMESSVDQTFGLHPVQQCCKSGVNNSLQSPAKSIDSKKPFITDSHIQAAGHAEKGSEDYGR
jgi:hypothetical protein